MLVPHFFSTWLYLIIADAVPAAGLIRHRLQILDPKLQNENQTHQDKCRRLTVSSLTTDRAPYLHVDPVLEAALGLRLHQPVTVLRRSR